MSLSVAFQIDTRSNYSVDALASSGSQAAPPAGPTSAAAGSLLKVVEQYTASRTSPPSTCPLSQHQYLGASFEWSPDGCLLACCGSTRPVRIFNASGDLLEQVVIPGVGTRCGMAPLSITHTHTLPNNTHLLSVVGAVDGRMQPPLMVHYPHCPSGHGPGAGGGLVCQKVAAVAKGFECVHLADARARVYVCVSVCACMCARGVREFFILSLVLRVRGIPPCHLGGSCVCVFSLCCWWVVAVPPPPCALS